MTLEKQLFIDVSPVLTAVGGISLVQAHEILGIFALFISCIYTVFKIKKDFFTKQKTSTNYEDEDLND